MDFWMLIFCVIPIIVTPITISPNGNSPERKMLGGMVIDAHRTAASKPEVTVIKAPILKGNSSILAINERYRRLIPYMTFYYANDLVTPTTESHKTNVEVEKAEIIEAGTVRPNGREARVIYTSTPHRPNNIPRYHGNRLTPINIASSNPTKLYYKEIPATYHSPQKSNPTHHSVPEYSVSSDLHNNREIFYDRYVQTQIKAPSTPFTASNRKPYLQFHENAEHANIQYYSPEQVEAPRYKLVPYEQTPPVKVVNVESAKKHYNPVELVPKDPIYIKPRPYLRPQQFTVYDNPYNQPLKTRKPSTTISEMYYERRPSVPVQPVVENGFKPIVNPILTTEAPLYTSTLKEESFQTIKSQDFPVPETFAQDQNKYRQEYVVDPVYASGKPVQQEAPDTVSLADLLNSLQINKAIPKPITRENVGASIRTLLQVLSTLNAQTQQNEVETAAVLSSPKPFEAPEVSVQSTPAPVLTTTSKPEHVEFQEEPYLAPVHTPSQHLDEYPSSGGSSQRFPLPVTSDNEGGTPGLPGVDYPILTVIPTTKFDCKTQRYKGFFADPETRCQVWHYCDLNGGQASFLCPNGTIFSQAALTCDWWFNVRCASTTQLYVLNESLYKYILPHSPKFPEDYSGPLVDKYLSLKFKEMEEQFKKNKKKKVASDKIDTDESTEKDSSSEENASVEVADAAVNRGNVIVESSGSSGNVQRLQDE